MRSPDTHPDTALAERAAGGDERAWREIYSATRERIFALLVYQVGNRDEALDILQETYLHAVKGMASYQGRGSLESWLCGIAIRRALDWKRRLLGKFKRTESWEGDWQLEESHPQPDPEEGRRLRKALSQLPDRQRTAVVLHEWMGYSFREIAEILGIGEATARVHAFRGRDALRDLLTEGPREKIPAATIQEEGS